MEKIFDIIKERACLCEKNGNMFTLPEEAKPYVVKHEEIEPTGSILTGDFWRLEKGENWLEIEYMSKDKCRTFQINPDRSILVIKGAVPQKISLSFGWDERA